MTEIKVTDSFWVISQELGQFYKDFLGRTLGNMFSLRIFVGHQSQVGSVLRMFLGLKLGKGQI